MWRHACHYRLNWCGFDLADRFGQTLHVSTWTKEAPTHPASIPLSTWLYYFYPHVAYYTLFHARRCLASSGRVM